MEMSRREGATGGGEDQVSLGHLCSCSFVSLKYHHPTYLLGKHLPVLQHASTHAAFENPPHCQTAALPTLCPTSPLINLPQQHLITLICLTIGIVMPMIVYCQPGTVLGSSPVLSHLILTTAFYSQYHCFFYFTRKWRHRQVR